MSFPPQRCIVGVCCRATKIMWVSFAQALSIGAEGSNLGFHACVSNALPPEPWPSPSHTLIYLKCAKQA